MFEFAFDVELARFAIVAGLFLTLLFFDRLKIAPGGMIVPGYIVLFINHPDQIFFTFLLAFLVYLFVGRILMNKMILFGRRRFTITILTGALFSIIAESFIYSISSFQPFIGFRLIGIIIPGLIANELLREQNKLFVLGSIGLVSSLTFGFVWIVSKLNWVLTLETSNIILLLSYFAALILLTLFSIYLLFFFKWEDHFKFEYKLGVG